MPTRDPRTSSIVADSPEKNEPVNKMDPSIFRGTSIIKFENKSKEIIPERDVLPDYAVQLSHPSNMQVDMPQPSYERQNSVDYTRRVSVGSEADPTQDIDLKHLNMLPVSAFSVTGDLPFNEYFHAPVTVSNASINAHSAMEYKLFVVSVDQPDFAYITDRVERNDPRVLEDPRLKRIFLGPPYLVKVGRINVDRSKVTTPESPPQIIPDRDPRRSRNVTRKESVETTPQNVPPHALREDVSSPNSALDVLSSMRRSQSNIDPRLKNDARIFPTSHVPNRDPRKKPPSTDNLLQKVGYSNDFNETQNNHNINFPPIENRFEQEPHQDVISYGRSERRNPYVSGYEPNRSALENAHGINPNYSGDVPSHQPHYAAEMQHKFGNDILPQSNFRNDITPLLGSNGDLLPQSSFQGGIQRESKIRGEMTHQSNFISEIGPKQNLRDPHQNFRDSPTQSNFRGDMLAQQNFRGEMGAPQNFREIPSQQNFREEMMMQSNFGDNGSHQGNFRGDIPSEANFRPDLPLKSNFRDNMSHNHNFEPASTVRDWNHTSSDPRLVRK